MASGKLKERVIAIGLQQRTTDKGQMAKRIGR